VAVAAATSAQIARQAFSHHIAQRNFQWWCGGFALWTILFLTAPAPTRAYVLGHELSHVLWTWLLGGHARNLRVGAKGGSVEVSVSSPWVTLAPYVLPLYTVVVLLLFGLVQILGGHASSYRPLWYGLLGASWAFHVTFTVSMIRKGQPDLEVVGWWFSLAVILGINLVVFGCTIAWIADLPMGTCWRLWWQEAARITTALARLSRWLIPAN
jgi:hypothetical protein